jgi:hypothetical protein
LPFLINLATLGVSLLLPGVIFSSDAGGFGDLKAALANTNLHTIRTYTISWLPEDLGEVPKCCPKSKIIDLHLLVHFDPYTFNPDPVDLVSLRA